MAATAGGDADSAWPPSLCEGHGSTESCPKCMYSKYEPEPEREFEKILSPTDIRSYGLYLSRRRAARFYPLASGSHPVSVYDVEMKCWPMYFRSSNGGKAYLTRGWSRFAKEKKLTEGDRITFYELNCKRGTGKRVFMVGVSRKGCIQILGAPIVNQTDTEF